MMTEKDIERLPKHRKDWLGIWGNTFAPAKTAGVGCEACIFGRGVHVCPKEQMDASKAADERRAREIHWNRHVETHRGVEIMVRGPKGHRVNVVTI